MERVLIGFVAAVLLAAPVASGAQLSAGARLGAAFAVGDVGGTLAMSDWTKGQIPLQLDVLYRVSDHVSIGGYFSWGFGLAGDVCADLDCSAKITRLGLQGTYAFTGRSFAPWVGAGLGYEWNTVEEGGVDGSFTGFEFLNLQVGGDFVVSERLRAGPYLMLSIAQYDDGGIGPASGPILDRKMHEWVSLGVRGTIEL